MQPLEGIRVLDITHVLAGPYCGYLLAQLGAEVVKLENPHEPDIARSAGPRPDLNRRGMGSHFLAQGGGKSCIALDLGHQEGAKAFRRLVSRFDVLIQNFRPGALAAMGLGYAELLREHPTLIYCTISGFGAASNRRAFDNVIQAASGLMAATGTERTGPLMAGAPVIDYSTGLTAALGVLAAVHRRSRTGQPQRLDVAMADTALALMSMNVADLAAMESPPAGMHSGSQANAGYGCYPTADGALMLGAYTPRLQRRLWRALGVPERVVVDTLDALSAEAAKSRRDLESILRTRTTAAWEQILLDAGVPASAVSTLEQAIADALRRRRPSVNAGRQDDPLAYFPGLPFLLEGAEPRTLTSPQPHGADTVRVLKSAGFSPAEIGALIACGAASQSAIN